MICDAYPDFEYSTEEHHKRNKRQHQEPISLLLFFKAFSLDLNQREPQFLNGNHLEKTHNELAVDRSESKLVSITKPLILVYVKIADRVA